MRSTTPLIAAIAIFAVASGREARGQLFGQRNVGRPLSQRLGPGLDPAGGVRGSERYLRGNRREGDFIGAANQGQREFVGIGSLDRRGRSRTRTRRPAVRRPRTVRPNPSPSATAPTGIDPPRLRIDFAITHPPTEIIRERLLDQYRRAGGIQSQGAIEVLVEGRTAILRGEVASEQDRTLAGLLARFEPGIDEVRNDLRVADSLPAAAHPADH